MSPTSMNRGNNDQSNRKAGATPGRAGTKAMEAVWEDEVEGDRMTGGGKEGRRRRKWLTEEEILASGGGGVKKSEEIDVFDAQKYFGRWSCRVDEEEEEEEAAEEQAVGDLPLSPLVEVGGRWRRKSAESGDGGRSNDFTSPRTSTGSSVSELEGSSALQFPALTVEDKRRGKPQPASPSARLANFLARFKISGNGRAASVNGSVNGSTATVEGRTNSAARDTNSAASAPTPPPVSGQNFYSHALLLPPNGKPPSPRPRTRFLLRPTSSSSSSATLPSPPSHSLRHNSSSSSLPNLATISSPCRSAPDRPSSPPVSLLPPSRTPPSQFFRYDHPLAPFPHPNRVYRSLFESSSHHLSPRSNGGLPLSSLSSTHTRSLHDEAHDEPSHVPPVRSKSMGAKRNGSSKSSAFKLPFLSRKLKVYLTDQKGNGDQLQEKEDKRTFTNGSSISSGRSSRSDYNSTTLIQQAGRDLYSHGAQGQRQVTSLESNSLEEKRPHNRMREEMLRIMDEKERRRKINADQGEEQEIELAQRLLRVVADYQQTSSTQNNSHRHPPRHHHNHNEHTLSRFGHYDNNNSTGSDHTQLRNINSRQSTAKQQATSSQNVLSKAPTSSISCHNSTMKQPPKEQHPRKEENYDSDSSSDLFEIETLAAVGMGYYRRDLPVYQSKDPSFFDNQVEASAGIITDNSITSSYTIPSKPY